MMMPPAVVVMAGAMIVAAIMNCSMPVAIKPVGLPVLMNSVTLLPVAGFGIHGNDEKAGRYQQAEKQFNRLHVGIPSVRD